MNSTPDDSAKSQESFDEIDLPPLPGPAWPIIPGYEIVDALGSGSIGTVYRARQVNSGLVVALKVIRADAIAADQLPRFHEEVKAIARLMHPSVVPILDVGEWQPLPGGAKIPFLASEYVAGGSLASRLLDRPMAWLDAVRLVETLARTMQVGHERGIVHGNLKPANVLLGEGGLPRVNDFALPGRTERELRRMVAGLVPGTIAYMAPEQADVRNVVGPAVDVYSLGAILYHLLAGQPPFSGATPHQTMEMVINDPPPNLAELVIEPPPELEALVLRCIAKSAGERPGSALELAEELRRLAR
jgi:serine/threonine protein kinase